MDPASEPIPLKNATAHVVAEIWCEVLEVPEVGEDDNFFDLGGHSILLQMVQDRVSRRTGKNVTLVDLFNHSTVRSLARHLDSDESTTEHTAPTGSRRRAAGRVNRLGSRRAQLGADGPDTPGDPRA